MNGFFEGKNILVTGGTGTIGSELVKKLLQYNVQKIIVLSRDEIKQFRFNRLLDDRRVAFNICDIRDLKCLRRILMKDEINIVYHTAAMKHVTICEKNPIEAVYTNVLGTQNIIDVSKEIGVDKLITISTDKAVHPLNVMGATKFIAEKITLSAGFSVVRFGNVSCSRGSVIPMLIEEMISKKSLTITDPNVTRFFMRVSDAVNLILKATTLATGKEIFILKMKAFRLQDLIDVLIEDIAPIFGIERNEIKIKKVGLFPGEKLHEELMNEDEAARTYDLGNMLLIDHKKSVKINRELPRIRYYLNSNNVVKIQRAELVNLVKECLKDLRDRLFY